MTKAKLISLGELIDQTWNIYHKHFKTLITISAWLLIVGILNMIALIFYPDANSVAQSIFNDRALSGTETTGVLLYAITLYLVNPILNIWIFGSTILTAKNIINRKSVNLKKIYRESAKLFLPALLVIILTALILIGAFLIAYGPSVILLLLAALFKSGMLTTLAAVIYIPSIFVATILAFRWGIFYIFSSYSVFIENTSGIAAIKRSKSLVQGRFWNTVVLFAVPKIIAIVIAAVLMYVFLFAVSLLTSTYSTDLNAHLRLFSYLDELIPIAAAILLNPVLIIADVLLYQSLKK